MTWLLIRLGFSVAIAAGVAWFIRVLNGPAWAAGLAGLLTGAGFFVLLTSIGEAFERMDQILAEVKAESQAFDPLRRDADPAPVMTKRDERVDVFDNVLDLLDRTVETPSPRPAALFAAYRYQGSRRKSGVKGGSR